MIEMITIEKEYMKCNICRSIFDAQDLVSVDELGVHLISGWVTPCCESFDYDEVPETPETIKSYTPFEPTDKYRRGLMK